MYEARVLELGESAWGPRGLWKLDRKTSLSLSLRAPQRDGRRLRWGQPARRTAAEPFYTETRRALACARLPAGRAPKHRTGRVSPASPHRAAPPQPLPGGAEGSDHRRLRHPQKYSPRASPLRFCEPQVVAQPRPSPGLHHRCLGHQGERDPECSGHVCFKVLVWLGSRQKPC